MAEISEKLRAFRKSRKMTLKDVADRAGCTGAYISQLEKGRANPSIATLKRIASAPVNGSGTSRNRNSRT